MSKNERLACTVLSHLKYNERFEFYDCPRNNLIMSIAQRLLGGRDPVQFMLELVDKSSN